MERSELLRWYERVLPGTVARSRVVEVPGGGRVHLLEQGSGPPLVLLHGSGLAAGVFLPLLAALPDVHALAPDLPDFPRNRGHVASVAWLDRLLDGLEIATTTLVGHSGGGVLAIRYALARPDRVDRLVVIGVPTLPGTRCPLPHRLMATPGVGRLLAKLPASRESVLRFAEVMGEGTTLAGHPDLVDLFVVAHREPATAAALRSDLRELISPAALLTRSGWGRGRLRVEDLRAVDMPTLLVWGQEEPLGEASVAQAAAELFPRAHLKVLPGGHAPWLGHADLTATAVSEFVRAPAG